ncbi:MAG: hypothetical protein H0V82_10520 [Candidatus Protochlamydia sp.]|nr:hypothetical protein [Candidatus Protochlamydia sp.]
MFSLNNNITEPQFNLNEEYNTNNQQGFTRPLPSVTIQNLTIFETFDLLEMLQLENNELIKFLRVNKHLNNCSKREFFKRLNFNTTFAQLSFNFL